MQIDMSRFLATFYVEADEHLEQMESSLLQLEANPQDPELLNTIFRGAHSIKGASTTFGVDEVGRFTHVLENLLDRMRDGHIQVSGEIVELLLTGVDVIKGLLASAKDGAPVPSNLESTLASLHQINQVKDGSSQPLPNPKVTSVAASPTRVLLIQIHPSRDFFRFGQDPLLILRELSTLGEVSELSVDATGLPEIADLDPESCYLSWRLKLSTTASDAAISEVFMFFDDGSKYSLEQSSPVAVACESPVNEPSSTKQDNVIAQVDPIATPTLQSPEKSTVSNAVSRPAAGAEIETVRVDRSRLDEMINQIGELVIGTSMVEQELKAHIGGGESVAMDQLAKIVRDLQEMSLSLRMVPIASTFQKMARVVRDLARKLDKKIDFVTEGDDTELDKSVVDQIGDPLVHMVRNAADHGIETAAVRIAAGKPETGRVTLRAYQQGGNIFIEICDDGRGLDRARLVSKAIERGLISETDNLSDNEICNLIFHPGFSTAEKITDVSGRGVGMDVVRRNVEALQGNVTIRSEFGKGSTLTVRLPLTLAILDGLLVRLDREVYVLPLLSVVESICIEPKEIRQIVGVGEVVMLRGEVIPVIRLGRVLNLMESVDNPISGLLVIVEDQGRRFALVVDELMGQQQVVIKNLETNFQKVPGVAGATILGNGRVALILDLYGISGLANSGSIRKPPSVALRSNEPLETASSSSTSVTSNPITEAALEQVS